MVRVSSEGPTTCYALYALPRDLTVCGRGAAGPELGQGPSPLGNFRCGRVRPAHPATSSLEALWAGGQLSGEALCDWRRRAVIGRHAGRSAGRVGAASS